MPDTEMLETICDNNEQIVPRLIGTDLSHPPTRRSISIGPDVLGGYPGRYQVAADREITVAIENGRLQITFPGIPDALPMFAEAPDRFFLSVGDNTILFERGPDGAVIGLVSQSQTGRTAARRLR